jgi:hypothetical protein
VSNLDSAGFQRQCQIDHLADPLDVGAVHDQIDG